MNRQQAQNLAKTRDFILDEITDDQFDLRRSKVRRLGQESYGSG